MVTNKPYLDFYEESINLANHYANKNKMGLVRSTMKQCVEGILDLIWENEAGGESKKNDFVTVKSKSGHNLSFRVDRHLYKDGNLLLLGECKANLDRCFIERTSSDLGRIIQGVPDRPGTFILALEDSISASAYNFYMDEGNIDHVFYLCDGKRSSAKPLWSREFRKEINEDKLESFLNFIRTFKTPKK